jgi:hypothetical protein
MIDAKNINSQPSADGQLPIDFYLNQSSVKKALASLDLKYNFVVVELAEALLREDLTVDEAADFLQENFNFTSEQPRIWLMTYCFILSSLFICPLPIRRGKFILPR